MRFSHLRVHGHVVATIAFKETGENVVYGIAVISKNESQPSHKKGRSIAESRCEKASQDYQVEWQEYNGATAVSNDIVEILREHGLAKLGECPSQMFKDRIQALRYLGF